MQSKPPSPSDFVYQKNRNSSASMDEKPSGGEFPVPPPSSEEHHAGVAPTNRCATCPDNRSFNKHCQTINPHHMWQSQDAMLQPKQPPPPQYHTPCIHQGAMSSPYLPNPAQPPLSLTITVAPDSQTMSIPNDNAGRIDHIYTVVSSVHDICLQSTKTYLDTHLVNRQARGSNPPPYSDRFRSHSHSSNMDTTSPPDNNDNSDSLIPPSTNSLLKNASSICNMLWNKSQRDRLDVLNVELMTVNIMGQLLNWAETIALGDYHEWYGAVRDAEVALRNVIDAGLNLCAWLNVPGGIRDMEALATEEGFGLREERAECEVGIGGYGC
ncbi:uncharacterized protein F4822DRAFT_411964 [Hypoxylon trugodes]|uniref:uncharacterized protein n=1 Tax=Hypoxylon trugodes TaxID=326681 RepID=UPI0021A146BC|nr:uncharacterized protein F4822DRAFT_411964 [Hypoxylon trugodes]KAI1387051.1 hypothetical protein F4822DRAFT_411964 [Hypoxylon trugodes]